MQRKHPEAALERRYLPNALTRTEAILRNQLKDQIVFGSQAKLSQGESVPFILFVFLIN